MLALTGTADKDTEKTVIGELLMKNPVKMQQYCVRWKPALFTFIMRAKCPLGNI